MYTFGQPTQTNIFLKANAYNSPKFEQSSILIVCVLSTLKIHKQITLKQALFGEQYTESVTNLVIYKADLGFFTSTAESLFVALFVRWILATLSFSNLNFQFSNSTIQAQKRITTYWLSLYDQPLDEYNNPDTSQTLDPNKF